MERDSGPVALTIGSKPIPERHIYTYRVDKEGCVTKAKRQGFGIVGSGSSLRAGVTKAANDILNFGLTMPALHWARANLLGQAVATEFAKHPRMRGVGGPFQVVRVTAEGLDTQWIWPAPDVHVNVEVRAERNATTVINAETHKTYRLSTVWALPRGMAGSALPEASTAPAQDERMGDQGTLGELFADRERDG